MAETAALSLPPATPSNQALQRLQAYERVLAAAAPRPPGVLEAPRAPAATIGDDEALRALFTPRQISLLVRALSQSPALECPPGAQP